MDTTEIRTQRQMLRHTIATLAYRGGKAVQDSPEGFAAFQINDTTRTPGKILSHICDLLDWGLSLAKGKQVWTDSVERGWDEEVARFFDGLAALDDYLASDQELTCTAEGL